MISMLRCLSHEQMIMPLDLNDMFAIIYDKSAQMWNISCVTHFGAYGNKKYVSDCKWVYAIFLSYN